MALSANSVFEVRTAGNDTNGGGFVTGAAGTDFSQQDAKNTVGNNISTVDAVAVGTAVITSATASFTAAIVGNIIYLQGGTGALAAGWYQVTVFTNATTITVDRNVAAGTGITMNIGGALASPGMAAGTGIVSGATIWVKAGTYTVTTASTNVSNGCVGVTLAVFGLLGYQTTRGDFGTQPLMQASGIATFTLISTTGVNGTVQNMAVDGAGLVSSRGIHARGLVFKCNAANCTNAGMAEQSECRFIRCTATGCSTVAAFLNGQHVNGVAYNNTVTGFNFTVASSAVVRCMSLNNTGATSDGFIFTGGAIVVNCVAYGNGREGYRIEEDALFITNCIAEANTGFGFNNVNRDSVSFSHCATFNNTGGAFNLGTGKFVFNMNSVTGTSTFFTNAAGLDFSLNNVAGGGAAARNSGYPGVLPVGGTGFLDIGALEAGSAGDGPPYIIGG